MVHGGEGVALAPPRPVANLWKSARIDGVDGEAPAESSAPVAYAGRRRALPGNTVEDGPEAATLDTGRVAEGAAAQVLMPLAPLRGGSRRTMAPEEVAWKAPGTDSGPAPRTDDTSVSPLAAGEHTEGRQTARERSGAATASAGGERMGAGAGRVRSGVDRLRAGADGVLAGADRVSNVADGASASADGMRGGADGTRAGADGMRAGADGMRAGLDGARAGAERFHSAGVTADRSAAGAPSEWGATAVAGRTPARAATEVSAVSAGFDRARGADGPAGRAVRERDEAPEGAPGARWAADHGSPGEVEEPRRRASAVWLPSAPASREGRPAEEHIAPPPRRERSLPAAEAPRAAKNTVEIGRIEVQVVSPPAAVRYVAAPAAPRGRLARGYGLWPAWP